MACTFALKQAGLTSAISTDRESLKLQKSGPQASFAQFQGLKAGAKPSLPVVNTGVDLSGRPDFAIRAVASAPAPPQEAPLAAPEEEASSAAGLSDWNLTSVKAVTDLLPGVRIVTLDAEISRELVPLSSAYTLPGQLASVRTSNGAEAQLPIASPPFSFSENYRVLDKLRGDINAGQTKVALYTMSVKAPLELYVEERLHPELYNVQAGSEVELGSYQKTGMVLRPILFLSRFPTVLIFARGAGVAAAKALVEANDAGSLNLRRRTQNRLYISAPNPEAVPYKDLTASWAERNIEVRAVVDDTAGQAWDGSVGSFQTLFDDDDDLEYDAEGTAVVICGDAATVKEVTALAEEAEIPESAIVRWQL